MFLPERRSGRCPTACRPTMYTVMTWRWWKIVSMTCARRCAHSRPSSVELLSRISDWTAVSRAASRTGMPVWEEAGIHCSRCAARHSPNCVGCCDKRGVNRSFREFFCTSCEASPQADAERELSVVIGQMKKGTRMRKPICVSSFLLLCDYVLPCRSCSEYSLRASKQGHAFRANSRCPCTVACG